MTMLNENNSVANDLVNLLIVETNLHGVDDM